MIFGQVSLCLSRSKQQSNVFQYSRSHSLNQWPSLTRKPRFFPNKAGKLHCERIAAGLLS